MARKFSKKPVESRRPEPPPDNVLFSVMVRRGPDIHHYDVVFEEDGISFQYLGGYWEKIKPFAGLGHRESLFLYSVLKKRRRETGEKRIEDFKVLYDDVVRVEITKREQDAIIKLWLRNGQWIEMRIPIKIYDIAYRNLKKRLEERLKEKGAWVVRRAR